MARPHQPLILTHTGKIEKLRQQSPGASQSVADTTYQQVQLVSLSKGTQALPRDLNCPIQTVVDSLNLSSPGWKSVVECGKIARTN